MTTAVKIFGILLVLGMIAGAIYLFSKSSTKDTENKKVDTTTTTTTNSGISGILAGLNLSGLKLSLA